MVFLLMDLVSRSSSSLPVAMGTTSSRTVVWGATLNRRKVRTCNRREAVSHQSYVHNSTRRETNKRNYTRNAKKTLQSKK